MGSSDFLYEAAIDDDLEKWHLPRFHRTATFSLPRLLPATGNAFSLWIYTEFYAMICIHLYYLIINTLNHFSSQQIPGLYLKAMWTSWCIPLLQISKNLPGNVHSLYLLLIKLNQLQGFFFPGNRVHETARKWDAKRETLLWNFGFFLCSKNGQILRGCRVLTKNYFEVWMHKYDEISLFWILYWGKHFPGSWPGP